MGCTEVVHALTSGFLHALSTLKAKAGGKRRPLQVLDLPRAPEADLPAEPQSPDQPARLSQKIPKIGTPDESVESDEWDIIWEALVERDIFEDWDRQGWRYVVAQQRKAYKALIQARESLVSSIQNELSSRSARNAQSASAHNEHTQNESHKKGLELSNTLEKLKDIQKRSENDLYNQIENTLRSIHLSC